jgi:hypothetical protein
MAAKETAMKANPAAEEADESSSRVGWLLGWVVAPGLILGVIFLGGVYVGANSEESWMTRAVMWLFG